MPELPEVEVIRRGLLGRLPGRRIIGLRWSGKRLRRPMPRKLLATHALHARFAGLERIGKYLLLRLDNQAVLLVHLGMTGRLLHVPAARPRLTHDHLTIVLDNDTELRYNDSRRFGSITLWPPEHAQEELQRLKRGIAPDPLSSACTGERLQSLAGSRRSPIKAVLMDSRVVSGLGNIYANELLFRVGLHPATPADRLKPAEWTMLAQAAKRLLLEAIDAGGSTISDYLDASGQGGYFQFRFAVYGRKGAPCPSCGAAVEKMALAGRSTYFCPRCQPARK